MTRFPPFATAKIALTDKPCEDEAVTTHDSARFWWALFEVTRGRVYIRAESAILRSKMYDVLILSAGLIIVLSLPGVIICDHSARFHVTLQPEPFTTLA